MGAQQGQNPSSFLFPRNPKQPTSKLAVTFGEERLKEATLPWITCSCGMRCWHQRKSGNSTYKVVMCDLSHGMWPLSLPVSLCNTQNLIRITTIYILVKRQWAGSWLGRVTRDEYQVLGSTSIPARLDTLVYWKPFSWLISVGTTRNTVDRLGWSRIGLAVLILNAAGAGLIGRPAVISGRYNKCHSLQLQNHYAHFPPLQHTHIHARHSYAELVMGNDHGFRGIVCWPWQEESCVIG